MSGIKIIKLTNFTILNEFNSVQWVSEQKDYRYANILNYCTQNQNKTSCIEEEEETDAVNSGHFILPLRLGYERVPSLVSLKWVGLGLVKLAVCEIHLDGFMQLGSGVINKILP